VDREMEWQTSGNTAGNWDKPDAWYWKIRNKTFI
jgi:hypothetical protein